MSDSAICLSWAQNFGLTPLGQRVVYGGLQGIYKRVRRYPSKLLPPGTDTEKP